MLDVDVTRDEIHFGASVTVRFMRGLRAAHGRSRHPLPKGCYQECGHDLTGNVSGICPECGSPIVIS